MRNRRKLVLGKKKIDYIYILGASHSGSTLLAMLLNSHPEVVTIGETSPGKMGDINTYRCSCGETINNCQFWINIIKRMKDNYPEFDIDNFGTKFEFPSNRIVDRFLGFEHRGASFELLRDFILRILPGWSESEKEIMKRNFTLVSSILAESGRHILVDSSKLAHRLKFLLHIPEYNIRVIHLIRDGRAVALTYMKQDEFADSREPNLRRGGRGMEAEHTSNSLPMEKAAGEWLRCLRSAEYLLAGIEKQQWIEVHYEELCKDTDNTLERIFEFIGLDPEKRKKDFRSVEHHIVGNGMRLDTTSEVKLDERWRQKLTEQDMKIFDRIAGKMNRKYGYQ